MPLQPTTSNQHPLPRILLYSLASAGLNILSITVGTWLLYFYAPPPDSGRTTSRIEMETIPTKGAAARVSSASAVKAAKKAVFDRRPPPCGRPTP